MHGSKHSHTNAHTAAMAAGSSGDGFSSCLNDEELSRAHRLCPPKGGVNGNVFLPRTYKLKLAAPREAFFLASICRAKNDPPVTEIRPWASFGV